MESTTLTVGSTLKPLIRAALVALVPTLAGIGIYLQQKAHAPIQGACANGYCHYLGTHPDGSGSPIPLAACVDLRDCLAGDDAACGARPAAAALRALRTTDVCVTTAKGNERCEPLVLDSQLIPARHPTTSAPIGCGVVLRFRAAVARVLSEHVDTVQTVAWRARRSSWPAWAQTAPRWAGDDPDAVEADPEDPGDGGAT